MNICRTIDWKKVERLNFRLIERMDLMSLCWMLLTAKSQLLVFLKEELSTNTVCIYQKFRIISDDIIWEFLLIGGVKVGDELIEINGMRLEASRFKESLKRLEDAMEDNTSVRFDFDVDLEAQNVLKL